MSLHEPTYGRRDTSGGNLDVPNRADQNGPRIHGQMDGQNQRADRPDGRPEGALSDVGLNGDADDSRSGADPEQLSAAAYRSEAIDGDGEPSGDAKPGSDGERDSDDEETGPVSAMTGTEVFVRASTDEHTTGSTQRYDGMQSHLGRQPERTSCAEGGALSDIVMFRARARARIDDEPDPCVAQASGYLARD